MNRPKPEDEEDPYVDPDGNLDFGGDEGEG